MYYNTIFFDLDDTLINTKEDLVASCLATLTTVDLHPTDTKAIRAVTGLGVRAMLTAAIKSLNLNVADFDIEGQLRTYYLDYYHEHINDYSKPYAGIEELLTSLAEHKYKIAIITNKYQALAERLISKFAFAPCINTIIGGDSVKKGKPDAESIMLACQRLNAQVEHCIMVGDHENDVRCAHNAGCFSLIAQWEKDIVSFDTSSYLDSGKAQIMLQPQDIGKFLQL